MKRILLTILIAICGLFASAQTFPFNNEWIDYSKTYYKFYVGKTGLYRISQTTLATIGIGNTPAEHFQLWRNGRQVPLYTSVPAGPLGGSDFIEFWGEMNDGKPDSTLYRDPNNIINDKFSFQTDTAAFFLTVNPAGGNLRMQDAVNNVAGNVLPPEPYFMYTEGQYYHDYVNPGYYIDAGEYVHSSAYDRGEAWVCWDIHLGQSIAGQHSLYPYAGGPDATFKINAFGNVVNNRQFKVALNADTILEQTMNYLTQAKASVAVPLSKLASGLNTITIVNRGAPTVQYDRMVVAQYELIYPRLFNFGDTTNFQFELPANPAGNYLEITNFNYGSIAPVLYDLTNGKRYIGDISNPALLKFALEPSMTDRKLVLVSLAPSNILTNTTFKTRNFVNLTVAANQGDYVIISHPLLFSGANGSNPVEEYRAYRNSAAGGGYNAKLYQIDELVDQFAFGIKKHPNSIRNFLRWARANFSVAPKFVFLIGHAVVYDQYQYYQNIGDPDIERLNIVPTFGTPASDILLTADVRQQIPLIPIGRLSVVEPGEVATYLTKVQEYEAKQATPSALVQDKAWTKNIVHVIGGNEPVLVQQLSGYMDKYKNIISDTLFGGNVTTFKKSSTETIQAIADQKLKDLFTEGLNQVVYFGHSSATVLDFNLDNPEEYNNPGKYPLFIAMGCLAGNFFNYNPARFYTKETLSERWLFSPNRGAIAFIASSHYGIPHYLDIYNTKTYTNEARQMYGKTYGEIIKQTVADVFSQTTQFDFYARMHTEQNTFHGDPALRPNTHPLPDYVVEDPMVKTMPAFISIADTSFTVEARFINQGKAINRDIVAEIKREVGGVVTIFRDTIPGIRFDDTVSFTFPINPITDKGLNTITVTIDVDNVVVESWENNNTTAKQVYIFEDDARPVYPLNFAIVNKQNIKLYASTANPFSLSKQFRMELDTTTLFNSGLKRTVNLTSPGGLLEFTPGITFTDSTVYYWRVSPLDSAGNPSKWNEASFIYLPNSDVGFNQSHFYQHTKSLSQRVFIDSATRQWEFHPVLNSLFIRTGVYPAASANAADYYIAVNGENSLGPGCGYNELIINVLDPITFHPMLNVTGTDYGSNTFCGFAFDRHYNFLFSLGDTASRRKAWNFLENVVPDGAYVAIRSNTSPEFAWAPPNTYAPVWQADTNYYGQNTLYNTLKNQGFSSIDQYVSPLAFAFVYKKNTPQYAPSFKFSENIYDRILMSVVCPTPDSLGYTTSPVLGAAKAWKQFQWRGSTIDAGPGDLPTVDLIGVNNAGNETTVMSNLDLSQQNVDISSISATQYPYLKLRIRNIDSINLTAYQLRYWRLTYVPIPEGAIAPNVFFQFKDTLDPGEPLNFKLAFKNISEGNFDSVKVKMVITDRNNRQDTIVSRFRPLPTWDTLHVRNLTNTAGLRGLNTFYLDVNPDNDQPEQFHFNNFMYRNFYVKSDNVNPLLDVTFDGVHILNRDIVASKPHIIIKLKDESKWLILDDTSGAKIQVRYPNGTTRTFFFNTNDTLKFTPAGNAPNPDNTATIDFLPYFPMDGDYELTVTGKDRSGNTAGSVEYKVGFQVINKPMISNMLNYPNPFTTSTAFVFTITGAEVPQNIKIQIMTITGKIVREITKDELGPLHVGRNITEFKWDGTDQYGQKLANGIYLYRVVTNLHGKALDKYKAEDDNTDKYFNKGYGKMYLMR